VVSVKFVEEMVSVDLVKRIMNAPLPKAVSREAVLRSWALVLMTQTA
jgi:hypothetical protein